MFGLPFGGVWGFMGAPSARPSALPPAGNTSRERAEATQPPHPLAFSPGSLSCKGGMPRLPGDWAGLDGRAAWPPCRVAMRRYPGCPSPDSALYTLDSEALKRYLTPPLWLSFFCNHSRADFKLPRHRWAEPILWWPLLVLPFV